MERKVLFVAIILLGGACSHDVEVPGADFTDAQFGIEMVFVEGGTFIMGCTPEQEYDCDDREKPAHKVTVSDFYIGKYEVTQKQWREVMETDVRQHLSTMTDVGWTLSGEGDNYPMYYVSWEEAREFIEKLNEKTGSKYRLPMETEWEYAARGGNKSQGYKYSGSDDIDAVAWYSGNSKSITHPVGTKKANELGIHDMSGNVNEWVSDWYGDYDGKPQIDQEGPASGLYPLRVFRSGGWFNDAWYARISYRNAQDPRGRTYDKGFRLALSPNL